MAWIYFFSLFSHYVLACLFPNSVNSIFSIALKYKPSLPFTLSAIWTTLMDLSPLEILLHSFGYKRKIPHQRTFKKTIREPGDRVAHRTFFLVVLISYCCYKLPMTLCLKTTHIYYLTQLEVRSSKISMCLGLFSGF